jgi:hypothetical protein
MRATDIRALSTPFSEHADRRKEVAVALGVATPTWNCLSDAILDDLQEQEPYGVGWWTPHPGTAKRILISDYLFSCAISIEDNLVEAALHQLEYLDFAERHSDRFANSLSFRNGKPEVEAPVSKNPLEEVGLQMARLHYAGVARALSSALDCIAAVTVGVAALPTNILRTDLGKVRESLKRQSSPNGNDGQEHRSQLALAFESLVSESGPPGWIEWTLHFRNMLVHRGRRLEIGQFVPRTPSLLDARGRPIPRLRAVTHLPKDPGRSEVEVFLGPDRPSSPILTEDAEQTLTGLIRSAAKFAEGTGAALLGLWNWRRDNPTALLQPAAQWPLGASMATTGFAGYAPGSYTYTPSMFMSHPVVLKRLRAAALDDRSRPQWDSFE